MYVTLDKITKLLLEWWQTLSCILRGIGVLLDHILATLGGLLKLSHSLNVQQPLLCSSLSSNHIDIFMSFLSFEPLCWGIVFIQIWAVSSDWFLTIALWEFSLSSRYRTSLKVLFYSHISKNKLEFHFSLSKVNLDEVVFSIFFQYIVLSGF